MLQNPSFEAQADRTYMVSSGPPKERREGHPGPTSLPIRLQQESGGHLPAPGARGEAPGVAGEPVGEPPPSRLSSRGSSLSATADASLGKEMQQLSFDLKEHLHVESKRTRTVPSCCSLCKAPQQAEVGGGRSPADTITGGAKAAPAASPPAASGLLASSEASPQGSASPATEGPTEVPAAPAAPAVQGAATTAGASRPNVGGGVDCCLTCSCPCHNDTNSSANCSSIVCIEGPRRPPTFASNLADLCKAFPSLIVSLLETADNDLQRAHALVRVVSDTNTGLFSTKAGAPMAKRKRCPDDCFEALEDPSAVLSGCRRGSVSMEVAGGSPSSGCSAVAAADQQQQQPVQHGQQHPLLGSRVSVPVPVTSAAAGASLAAGPTTSAATTTGTDSAANRGANGPGGLGRELLPEAWCDEVAERLMWAIVTATSGDDAKAKAAALLREHAMQLTHAQQDEPSQAELAKEAERQELAKRVELLQNDKLLLARAVKAQHEKLQTLQQSLAAKTEETRYLVQELSGAQQRLRSLRDAASALLLGASANRNNSPCRDNTFDRRFPDVC
ncbi:hypothetical protein, conserved [Eimeria maxima]|uniref:CUE domain-containing protein n=1 Tax=Eimeria maxima TaxID=5804 RepID=U6M0I9_EIMMA|nr:hypothetical protein, conserved [Eimeria maxima]CDJ55974.1 hypothetical protein, conserved [Eimeria maxima]